jgi:hypothetical protein
MDETTNKDPADPRVMSGEVWFELADTIRAASERVLGSAVPDTPQERAAGFRYLTQFLEAGINFCVAHADGDYPEFTRMMDLGMRWGLDSPDCLYLVATLREGESYRIWGDPGSANHMDIQVNTGHYALGDIGSIRTLGSLSGDELVRGKEDEIEVVVGGEPRETNWVPSGEGARFVMVRQNFYDWESEDPANLLIERIGSPVARPVTRTDQVAERIDLLRSWIAKGGLLWEKMSQSMLSMEPNSTFTFAPEESANHSGLKGQIYCQGNFRCKPSEAVVFELVPPQSRHWNISLANVYWEAVDFVTRQGSLNGCQAEVDPDGVFRVVIAHRDPGVWNWLDPCGHEEGTVIARFILADGELPQPVSHVVPVGEVRSLLPSGTRTVDPAEREATLRRRRDALWRRYRR